MSSLTDRIIIIAGAGRGLGRQAAIALGARGAAVAVNDINPDSAAETARLVRAAGGRAEVHIADVSKKFPVQALFNAVEDQWGVPHALINNARVVPHKPLLDMDEWDWRRTLDVNLTGAFVLFQVAGRVLRAGGGGVVIQLCQVQTGAEGLAAYQASLQALSGFAGPVRAELEAEGIQYASVTYHESEYEPALGQILAHLNA